MLKEKDAVIRRAIIVLDGFLVAVACLLAFALRYHTRIFHNLNIIPPARAAVDIFVSPNDYFVVFFFLILLWCGTLYLNGTYGSLRTKTLRKFAWIVAKSAILTFAIFGSLVFIFKLKYISRLFFIVFMVMSTGTILIEKMLILSIMRYIRRRGYNYRRLLIIGTGKRAANFINRIRNHPEWGLRVSGIIDDTSTHLGKVINGINVVGGLEDISGILHKFSIDEAVFIVPRSRLNYIEKAIKTCEIEGIKATIAVDLFDMKLARSHITELDGIPLVTFETTIAEESQLFIKRAIDLIVSMCALIVLSPVFILTAVLIKITSPGPIMYTQQRIGLSGRKFLIYKFRTMYKGAHKRLSEIAALNEMEGPIFKIKNDPRITPVGRVLRKFSIDELPQFFNVFMGYMSLVGPRPPLPNEVKQYEPWQRRRLSMRPGLTCLWQVSGRNRLDFNEWMELDLKYLDNWSLLLDLKILMKTIPVVLFGIGAY